MAYGMSKGTADPNYAGNIPPPSGGSLRSVYDAAATTQASDYDDIMRGYDDLLSRSKNTNQLNYVPVNPVFQGQLKGTPYQRSQELGSALGGFGDFSKTGGYSDTDIANIRERGISPIRSIYASAQENLKRQKSLQGGYSPNYGAVSAKMAREASNKIGDLTTKVNADIAQMVQSGKLSGLQGLGSLAARDNELSNEFNLRNTDLENKVNLSNTEEQRRVDEINKNLQMQIEEINNRNRMQGQNTELNALGGKTSLYGTNPALTETFGNQVLQNNAQNMQAVTTANAIKNQRANLGLNLVQSQLGRPVAGRG